jgi:hypothetical protein
MQKTKLLITMMFGLAISVISTVWALGGSADEVKDYSSDISSLTVVVGHRVHGEFHQTITTEMNKREQIGDTDFYFEAVEFYPHFAITDSTKKTISLSDEPTNVAFKIRVYESDELVDETWSFYHIQIPHYSRTSLLKFDAVAFEYRGELFEKKKEDQKEHEQEGAEGEREAH